MDFALTGEQRMIAETAAVFFAEHATSERTRAAMAGDGIDLALWRMFCRDLGFSGIHIPEAAGGAGLGMVELALVAAAAGEFVAAIPLPGHVMATTAMATDGVATPILDACLAGDAIATAGEASALIVETGNAINGRADYVPYGGTARSLLLIDGGRGWLVSLDAPGVIVEARATMDATRPLARIHFADALAIPVSPAAVAGARAAGLLCLAAEALGGARAALDKTVAYARERTQFGRSIGSFQAVKHRLADRSVEIEQARSAILWAACALDEGAEDAPLAIHAAKAFCADCFARTAADMMQFHGGIGFTWEHDTHLYFKRARSIATLFGNPDFHRERIAELMLDGVS